MSALAVRKKIEYESMTVRVPKHLKVLVSKLGNGNATQGVIELLEKNEQEIIKALKEKDAKVEKESIKKRKKAC